MADAVATAPPATAGNAPGRRFEDDLETALLERQKKWDFAWLNSPFALWAFSALAIGLLSYFYNAYPSCVGNERTDNRQSSKLLYEISERRKKINSLMNMTDSLTDLKTAVRLADPDQTYIFSDLQGKKLPELFFDLDTVFYRWNLIPRKSTTGTEGTGEDAKYDPTKPPPFSMSDPYWVSAYFRFADSTNRNSPHDLLEDTKIFIAQEAEFTDEKREMIVKEKSDKFRLVAINLRAREDFDRFGELSDTSHTISEWKCLRRLFWPNW